MLLVLGDSLSAAYGMPRSQGWVSLLERRLDESRRPWQVVNASISGDTTGQGLKRLPQLLSLYQPQCVIIELGGNDGLQGKPLWAIRSNLRKLIQEVRAAGGHPALVAMQLPPNYGNYYVDSFRRLFGEIAESEDIPLLHFNLEEIASTEGMMQPDGIHPAPEAQETMLDALWPALNAELLSLEQSLEQSAAGASPEPG